MTVKITIDPGSRPAVVSIQGDATEEHTVDPGEVREFRIANGRTITVAEGKNAAPAEPE